MSELHDPTRPPAFLELPETLRVSRSEFIALCFEATAAGVALSIASLWALETYQAPKAVAKGISYFLLFLPLYPILSVISRERTGRVLRFTPFFFWTIAAGITAAVVDTLIDVVLP